MSVGSSGRIVVVGGSLAGLRCVEALRRLGHGGEIVVLSAEKHAPYDRPPLSKQFLVGDWDEDRLALRRDGLDDLGAVWRFGATARALHPDARCVELTDGERVAYDGLVIATGASPRRLPGTGDRAGVHVLRGLEDARALRAALEAGGPLVVIGAGFIGLEVAASARARGLEVVVVEALEAPLMRGLGATLGRLVGERHRDRGVDVRCGVRLEGLVGDGRVEAVALADGQRLEAATVLVGIGVTPVVDWLASSGLDVRDGVLCDATGATAIEDVVAAGDCARWHSPRVGAAVRHEHWTSAVEQAGVAAARLLGGPGAVAPLDAVPYVWSDQFEMRLAIAGEPAAGDAMHVAHGTLEDDRFIALMGRAGRLVGAVAMRRPRPLNTARELLEQGASFEDAIAAIG